MHNLVYSALSETIPRIIETGFNWIKELVEDPSEEETHKALGHHAPKVTRKPTDRTKISAEQFDIIRAEKDQMDFYNGARMPGLPRITQNHLVKTLNKRLGLNKSKSFYATIWSGHVERPKSHTPENPQ